VKKITRLLIKTLSPSYPGRILPKVKASAATKKAPAAKPKAKKAPAASTPGGNQKMIKPVAATKPAAAKSAPQKKTAPATSKKKASPAKITAKKVRH
jgi:hypothetical protein